jgi:hypothetical protein
MMWFDEPQQLQAERADTAHSTRSQDLRTTLSPRRFANRLIYLQLRTRRGKEKRPPETFPAAFFKAWLRR